MKRVLSVGLALLVVSFAALTVVGAVSAQAPEVAMRTHTRSGLGSLWGNVRLGLGSLSEVITSLLGLTEDELHMEREAGKSFAEIASEQGVNDQVLVDAMVDAQRVLIAQAVDDGKITAEQAEALIARTETMTVFRVNKAAATGGMAEQAHHDGALWPTGTLGVIRGCLQRRRL